VAPPTAIPTGSSFEKLPPVDRPNRSTVLNALEAFQNVKTFGYKTNLDKDYELGPVIGAGSFATVHLATDRKTGQRFAVKSMFKKVRSPSTAS
jgi:serine/threonine protein kinase